MNRATRQRRANRGCGAGLSGGRALGGGGFLRVFRQIGRNGLGRRTTRCDHGSGRAALGWLRLRDFPMLRYRDIGLVGDVVGNVVPVEAAKPDRRVLVD